MHQMVYGYLKRVLVEEDRGVYQFRVLGPRSLIYDRNEVVGPPGYERTITDKIIVYVTRDNVVIIHDGEGVVNNMEMIPMLRMPHGDDASLDEEILDGTYLQPVLERF